MDDVTEKLRTEPITFPCVVVCYFFLTRLSVAEIITLFLLKSSVVSIVTDTRMGIPILFVKYI